MRAEQKGDQHLAANVSCPCTLEGATLQAKKVSSMERAEKDPVLIRAKEDVQRLEEQREEIAQELDDLTTEIRELRARIRNGDPERKGESGKLLGDVKYWLKAARETECEIDAIRRKESEITGDYGLDLEAARYEIGCRLARLRPCDGAG